MAPRAAAQIHVDSNGFHYVVNGNTLLPASAVRAAIEPATTPKEAIEKLNAAYQAAGWFMVVIGGEVNNKLVALTVLQGRITKTTAPDDLAPYFSGLVDNDGLNRNGVIRATLQAEQYLARQGLRPRVSFSPAPEVGGSMLTATAEPIPDAKPWNAGLSFGNLGSRYSSRYLAGANASVRPGGGLELNAAYSQGIPGLSSDSAGSQYQSASAGFSVVTPLGTYGANWLVTSYKIGESQFPLYPFGDINQAAITGTQLLFADEATRINLNEAFNYNDNEQRVFPDTPVPFLLTDQHYGYFSLGMSFIRATSLFGQSASFGASVTGLWGVDPPHRKFSTRPTPGFPTRVLPLFRPPAATIRRCPRDFPWG